MDYSHILDEIEKADYNEYRYLMFMLPILLDAKTVVETGLALGHSTRIFLAGLSHLPEPQNRVLHTFELYPENCNPESVKSLGFPARWELHVADSTKSKGVITTPIDLLYLDADHSYENVTAELESFADMVRSGGIIMTQDYWPGKQDYPHPNVTWKALHDWGEPRGWKDLLFKTPEGMTVLYHP